MLSDSGNQHSVFAFNVLRFETSAPLLNNPPYMFRILCRFSNNIRHIVLKIAVGWRFEPCWSKLETLFVTKQKLVNMSFQGTVYPSNGENITDAVKNVLVINYIVNIPLALTSIIGNTLVLHAVWKTPVLRSPSMFLLCGLALSDLAVGAIVQPLFIAKDLLELYSQSQRLKQLFLSVYNMFGFCLCGISLCTVTAISVDRLIAVQKSLQYPSIVTLFRVKWLLMAIWTICIILASAHFWLQMVQLVSVVVVICACLCISAYCYVKIFKAIRHHQNAIRKQMKRLKLTVTMLTICRR